MEPKPTGNVFEAVHIRIAVMKEKMRKAQLAATGARQQDAQKEAVKEAFDRPAITLPGLPDDETT
jgi:hypothetical protein